MARVSKKVADPWSISINTTHWPGHCLCGFWIPWFKSSYHLAMVFFFWSPPGFLSSSVLSVSPVYPVLFWGFFHFIQIPLTRRGGFYIFYWSYFWWRWLLDICNVFFLRIFRFYNLFSWSWITFAHAYWAAETFGPPLVDEWCSLIGRCRRRSSLIIGIRSHRRRHAYDILTSDTSAVRHARPWSVFVWQVGQLKLNRV